jgi:iron complex outermembrane receptor protein
VYRTHGDRFLYDRRRPGQFENRHRSHAAALSVRGDSDVTAALRLHVGAEAGGDWIRSSNLGDHAIAHTSLATELRDRVGARTTIVGGLRYDAYSRFGTAWSPSLAASTWVAAPLKIRAAVGHAFRIPTFTELYYRDPNNEGQETLHPERGWSYEIGADWLPAPRWVATVTAFERRDRDVIDWVRNSPQVPWRSANIRRLQTRGLELAARRSVGADASAGVEYAYITADADPVALLSKYVMDYARHRIAGTASLALAGAIDLGGRAGWTRRADGRDYALVDVRVAHPLRRVRVFLEGTNLLDQSYQAVRGVDMPGRAVRAGLEVPAF